MDRVRLGRALGFGARAAAKTLVQAADAAMSPSPSAAAQSSAAAKTNAAARPPQPQSATQPASAKPRSTTQRSGNIVSASRNAGRAAWEPVKRHSRELWLEVTGGFFALLALSMGAGVWKLHNTFRTALTNHTALWSQDLLKFYLATAACLMFAYFSISNFIRVGRSNPPKPR